jgi:hypothetical protein
MFRSPLKFYNSLYIYIYTYILSWRTFCKYLPCACVFCTHRGRNYSKIALLIVSPFHIHFFHNSSTALVGLRFLNVKASRSQSDTPHSVRLLWTSDQPVNTQHSQEARHPFPPVRFEPTIPATERPQTHALDCTATGIGSYTYFHL